MNPITRRTFLKGSLASGVLAVAAGAGLLRPTELLAATWPQAAFDAKGLDEAVKALYGSGAAAESSAININTPIQAENGAVVPITVSTSLPAVESIAIFVKENAQPLVAVATLTGAEGYFAARMKMGKTSDVKVVVKSQGKLHTATQQVKVTVGGCGG